MADYVQRRVTMVDTQVRPSDVTSFPIINAMLTVPRELFVPADKRDIAYVGEHLDLGEGRVLLDPRTFAKMLEALDATPAELVLVIGAGLGYGAAVLSHLAQAVVAVEEDEALAKEAASSLTEAGIDTVAVETGSLADGAPRHGPYDAILIEGAVETLPDALTDQLKDGGRILAIFSEGPLGVARLGLKTANGVSWREAFDANAPVLPGFAAAPEFVF